MYQEPHFELESLQATDEFATRVAQAITEFHGDRAITIALSGTLGAGKTQWARYFCAALGVPSIEVTSPTYVLLQRYVGKRTIYHFDFYRLDAIEQVWDLGIDELFEQSNVVVLIEWAEKFLECLPHDHLRIALTQTENGQQRQASVEAFGTHRKLLDQLAN